MTLKQTRDTRQMQLLDAITAATAETGFAPTLRELGDRLGLTSVAYISRLLHRMRDLGVVDFNDRKPRTLRVTDDNRRSSPEEGQDKP